MFSSTFSRKSFTFYRKLCTVNQLKPQLINDHHRGFCQASDNSKIKEESTFANLLRHSNLMQVRFMLVKLFYLIFFFLKVIFVLNKHRLFFKILSSVIKSSIIL